MNTPLSLIRVGELVSLTGRVAAIDGDGEKVSLEKIDIRSCEKVFLIGDYVLVTSAPWHAPKCKAVDRYGKIISTSFSRDCEGLNYCAEFHSLEPPHHVMRECFSWDCLKLATVDQIKTLEAIVPVAKELQAQADAAAAQKQRDEQFKALLPNTSAEERQRMISLMLDTLMSQ